MRFKYLIIEDNPKAVESLKLFMKDFQDYEFIGNEDLAQKGILKIIKDKPDLVFLDVELSEGTGFDVIKNLYNELKELPSFIMITGHDHYAKEALNLDALYFLSKPFDPDELVLALNKFEKIQLNKADKLNIKSIEGHHVIAFNELAFIMSEGNYTHLFKTNDSIITASKPLNEIAGKLPNNFFQIHKSYIINRDYIEFINASSKEIVLTFPIELKHIKSIINKKGKVAKDNKQELQIKSLQNKNKITLPIGKMYYEEVKKQLF